MKKNKVKHQARRAFLEEILKDSTPITSFKDGLVNNKEVIKKSISSVVSELKETGWEIKNDQ